MKIAFINIKYALICWVFYSFGILNGYGQNTNNNTQSQLKQNLIPPSPEAASLGKYVDIPVGLYSGVPNINIPITEITAGNFKLPISLSYHASGVRVSEVASWVGSGWTLNAGGMINRTIRGRRDEAGGYSNPSSYTNIYFNLNGDPNELDVVKLQQHTAAIGGQTGQGQNPTLVSQIQALAKGCTDSEPDIFTFNTPTGNGRFLFDRTMKPVFFPKQNIKIIKHPLDFSVGNSWGTWELLDEDGYRYTFGTKNAEGMGIERVNSYPITDGQLPLCPSEDFVPTGWWLTKIVTPDKKDSIMLFYTGMDTNFKTISETYETPAGQYPVPTMANGWQPVQNITYANGCRLTKIISTSGQTVEFIVGNGNRLDLDGGRRLSAIKIFYKEKLIKYFNLSHSYKNLANDDDVLTNSLATPQDFLALQLDSVTQYNPQNESLPPYKFIYNTGSRPMRMSKNQDHWGYYNGAFNGGKLIPELMDLYVDRMIPEIEPYIHGADREPRAEFAKAGILEKIIYPTKGTAEFEYEGNEYSNLFRKEYERNKQVINFSVSPSEGVKESQLLVIDNKCPKVNVTINTMSLAPCGYDPNNGGIPVDCYINLVPVSINPTNLPNNSSIITLVELANIENLQLLPGTYKLVGKAKNSIIGVSLNWENAGDTLINKKSGGLRVKRTILKDPISTNKAIIKEYTYTENCSNKSSGRTLWIAGNNHFQNVEISYPIGVFQTCDLEASGYILSRTATTSNVSVSLSGQPVGYGEVTVRQINDLGKDLGKSVSKFHNPQFSTTINETINPFGLHTRFGETAKYGSPTYEAAFEFKNNGYVKKKEYFTKYDSLRFNSLCGFKVMEAIRNACPWKYYTFLNYKEFSEWYYPTYTKTIVYDENQHNQVTEEFLEYDISIQKVIRKKQKLPNSEQIIQTFSYTSNNAPILLQQEETWKAKGQEKTKIDGKLYHYGYNHPIEILVYENPNVVVAPINAPETQNLDNYVSKVKFDYDDFYKMIQQQATKDIPQSYLWGYKNNFPIAQIINATASGGGKSTFKRFFHTSFEFEDDFGTEVDIDIVTSAKTGKKSKLNGFTKTINSLTNGKYVLTYWKLENNVWTFQTENIDVLTGTYTINIQGQVDEIRFYPSEAAMTTYTYEPFVGITSITDPNNQTIYYEYDGFGRLKWVKDFQGNILKQNEYFYRQD